jgi:hypothetical protein
MIPGKAGGTFADVRLDGAGRVRSRQLLTPARDALPGGGISRNRSRVQRILQKYRKAREQ